MGLSSGYTLIYFKAIEARATFESAERFSRIFKFLRISLLKQNWATTKMLLLLRIKKNVSNIKSIGV